MRNIILQHFDGEMRPLDYESMWNIMDYADMVDADYKLVLGKPFRENLTNACQKVHMLHEEFDDYDNVLMLDIDMFRPEAMRLNVFDQPGIGLYADVQQNLHRRLIQWYPMLGSMDAPYWGGAIYKMDRLTRQTLRKQLGGNEGWMQNFNKPYNYDTNGSIGNGSTVEVELSVYDTSRKNIVGTRLDKVTVIDHVEYIADTSADMAPPPLVEVKQDSEVLF